jgi:hypothetical protein
MATKPMQHAATGAPKKKVPDTTRVQVGSGDVEEWVTAGFGNSAYKVSGPRASKTSARMNHISRVLTCTVESEIHGEQMFKVNAFTP